MNIHLNRITKVALALAGVAGLALAAETAQAGSPLDLNGTGSSSGRQFAGNRPALLCDATPVPLLFVSSEPIPNKYEWRCGVTVGGTTYQNSRIRYSSTKSSDAFVKQPLGTSNTAAYLDTPNTILCSAGGSTTILGVSVEKYVCPANMSIVQLPVHWGGSDVEANSIHQAVFGVPPIPPSKFIPRPQNAHLTTDPKAVVPFAIMVGANVRKMMTSTMLLTSLTKREIYAIMTGNVANWTDLGYGTASGPTTIDVCQRDPGSGALAALDEIIMLPKYWGSTAFRGIYNASTTDMINCLNSHPNSIGYLDSDSVIPAIFPTGGPYQIQIDGQPVNAGVPTGLAGLTALRCGRYIYWTNWNFVTRSAPYELTPMFAATGTTAALAALGTAMSVYNTQPNSNPLPDFWLSLDDMFVFKGDRGPHHWFSPTTNSSNPELIANVCN